MGCSVIDYSRYPEYPILPCFFAFLTAIVGSIGGNSCMDECRQNLKIGKKAELQCSLRLSLI